VFPASICGSMVRCVTFSWICASLDWFKPVLRCIPYKQSQILVSFGLLQFMKFIFVVLLASFCLIEAAHLNYHRFEQRCTAETVDFWQKFLKSYIVLAGRSCPHRGCRLQQFWAALSRVTVLNAGTLDRATRCWTVSNRHKTDDMLCLLRGVRNWWCVDVLRSVAPSV